MTISGNSINIKDVYLILPASRTYSKLLNDHKIKIRFPERLVGKKINEVKIIPQYNGKYFKIAYCYEIDEENLNLNRENSLAIKRNNRVNDCLKKTARYIINFCIVNDIEDESEFHANKFRSVTQAG